MRVLPATFSSRSIVDCEEMGTLLPTSFPGLSSYRLGRARRDPGWVWSRATFTIENIREGSSVIRPFVGLSFVALRPPYSPRCLTVAFGPKLRKVSIPTFISRLGRSVSRQFTVVLMLLPSYPLDLRKVGHTSTVHVEQRNFIPK